MSEDKNATVRGEQLLIRGRFQHADGTSVPGASICAVFLGDPPTNCGTVFDLVEAPAHTDDLGQFELAIPGLDQPDEFHGPPGVRRGGCYWIMAVQDARTLGYIVATGEELAQSPVRLTALPTLDLHGRVTDERGRAVAGARVEVSVYLLHVGRGPHPSTPLNFWLSRPAPGSDRGRVRVAELVAVTQADGSFVLPQAPAMPRGFLLMVSQAEHATVETICDPPPAHLQLILRAGAVIRIRIALPDGNAAAGYALNLEGEPHGETWSIHRDEVTNAAGLCQIRSLPAGHYTVRFVGGGNGTWAVPAIVVDVAEGALEEVSVMAVEGSILCGTVTERSTGAPISRAVVRFHSDRYPDTASTIQAAYTDETGRFAFEYAVAPGPLEVRVYARRQGKAVGQTHQILVGRQPRTELSFALAL